MADVRNLRILVSDVCDLKCFFCHHDGQLSNECYLSPDELAELAGIAAEFGVEEVKISGSGDPLARKDIIEVIEKVSSRPRLKHVSLTTNGLRLNKRIAQQLKDAGLEYLRVSLFTLDPRRYAAVTGTSQSMHSIVTEGITEAIKAGLKVKLNVVLLKGLEREIQEFVRFSVLHGILSVKFIEFATPHWLRNHERLSASVLDPAYVETKLERVARESIRTAFNRKLFYFEDGAIAEVHRYLCNMKGGCPYCIDTWGIRVSSGGRLLPCFLSRESIDISKHLRNRNRKSLRSSLRLAIEQTEQHAQQKDLIHIKGKPMSTLQDQVFIL